MNADKTFEDDRASTSSMMEYMQSIPHVKASAGSPDRKVRVVHKETSKSLIYPITF
ncbi:MAG: hypothetical protein ACP5GS_01860 [Nitrososphaeria archaeon]